MTWQRQAACIDDDPREWDDYGTGHAHYVCRQMCPVRTQCLAAAVQEKPVGQMRANIPFGVQAKPNVYLTHEVWLEMHLAGMSFNSIARKSGVHHTAVMRAIRKLEAVA